MIDGRNFLVQTIKSYSKTYDNFKRIATGQGDDCTTECFLDYPYFKINYKLVVIDLIKQQKLVADQKTI